MAFKIKTDDVTERKELKGRVPAPVAAWFEEQANESKVPLIDVVGQALMYAYRSANRTPRPAKPKTPKK